VCVVTIMGVSSILAWITFAGPRNNEDSKHLVLSQSWMKSVLGLTILAGNFLDVFRRRPGVQVLSLPNLPKHDFDA
jgi:hypothetical protein